MRKYIQQRVIFRSLSTCVPQRGMLKWPLRQMRLQTQLQRWGEKFL